MPSLIYQIREEDYKKLLPKNKALLRVKNAVVSKKDGLRIVTVVSSSLTHLQDIKTRVKQFRKVRVTIYD